MRLLKIIFGSSNHSPVGEVLDRVGEGSGVGQGEEDEVHQAAQGYATHATNKVFGPDTAHITLLSPILILHHILQAT